MREFTVQRSAADALRLLCSLYPRASDAMIEVVGRDTGTMIVECAPNRLGRLVYDICSKDGEIKAIKDALIQKGWAADEMDDDDISMLGFDRRLSAAGTPSRGDVEKDDAENQEGLSGDGGSESEEDPLDADDDASSSSSSSSDYHLQSDGTFDSPTPTATKRGLSSLSKAGVLPKTASSARFTKILGSDSTNNLLMSAESFRVKSNPRTKTSHFPPPPRDVSLRYEASFTPQGAEKVSNSDGTSHLQGQHAAKKIHLSRPYLPVTKSEANEA